MWPWQPFPWSTIWLPCASRIRRTNSISLYAQVTEIRKGFDGLDTPLFGLLNSIKTLSFSTLLPSFCIGNDGLGKRAPCLRKMSFLSCKLYFSTFINVYFQNCTSFFLFFVLFLAVEFYSLFQLWLLFFFLSLVFNNLIFFCLILIFKLKFNFLILISIQRIII